MIEAIGGGNRRPIHTQALLTGADGRDVKARAATCATSQFSGQKLPWMSLDTYRERKANAARKARAA